VQNTYASARAPTALDASRRRELRTQHPRVYLESTA